MRPAACSYCGRPSALLCDFVLGAGLGPDTCEWDPVRGERGAGCPNKATVSVGADDYVRTCDGCAAHPALRRRRTRKPVTSPRIRIDTCDAAACRACAARAGWKRIGAVMVCRRPGGCQSDTVDRCHLHAGEAPEARGELDAAGVGQAREAVKTACAALGATFSAGAGHRDTKPENRWRENTDLFLAELREGRRWQEWAAGELRLRGLCVELPTYEERARIEDADRFTANDTDIVVRGSAVGDVVLEVKSRLFWFTDALGYPYPTALVDTVDGWNAKAVQPRAVLLVSRPARRIIVVSAATRPSWRCFFARDRVRNTEAEFFECPRELLCSLEWLVKKLLP